MKQSSAHLRVVADDDAVAPLFYASRVGAKLAVERSDLNERVSMKRYEIHRIWRPQTRLWLLGMPKLSGYEAGIIDVILNSGRPDVEGYLTWTAMRPGQTSIINSLAHETSVHHTNTNRALNKLIKIGLVQRVTVGERQAVKITDLFHWMMFETQWRCELYNTAPSTVVEIVAGKGWRWLLYRSDDLFQGKTWNPRKIESRRVVLEELARQVRES